MRAKKKEEAEKDRAASSAFDDHDSQSQQMDVSSPNESANDSPPGICIEEVPAEIAENLIIEDNEDGPNPVRNNFMEVIMGVDNRPFPGGSPVPMVYGGPMDEKKDAEPKVVAVQYCGPVRRASADEASMSKWSCDKCGQFIDPADVFEISSGIGKHRPPGQSSFAGAAEEEQPGSRIVKIIHPESSLPGWPVRKKVVQTLEAPNLFVFVFPGKVQSTCSLRSFQGD